MHECTDCYKKFKDIKKFENHKKVSINCKKYKNILFICEKCNFQTKGIKNINFHIENCNGEMSKNINFKKLYEIQKIENSVLRNIIKKNLSIELSDVINYDKNIMNIYENNNFKINIHKKETENIETIEYSENLELEIKNNKKETYRKSKYIETRVEPTQEEKNDIIKEIDKENFKDNNNQNKNNCDELFLEIRNNRIYSKTLIKIKNWRLKKTNYLNFENYIELIKLHISKLEEVFNSKKYNNKKIIQTISKCLSPFELKLLQYGNYYLEEFNNDDIQYLSNILYKNINKDYTYFDSKKITSSLFNISSNIFTIQDNLKRILRNKYGFNNIIYLCPKKSDTEDYYSYYTLTKIENGVRCWEMDCRLHKLTNNIINDLYLYLVEIFRKYYYCVFHDNEYRENFEDNSLIFISECKQLLQTITFICNQRNVNRFLRDFIKVNCEYKPTNMDKFNIYSDDTFLKKNYKKKYKHDLNIFTIIDKLFDNISSKQISNFYENNIKEHE